MQENETVQDIRNELLEQEPQEELVALENNEEQEQEQEQEEEETLEYFNDLPETIGLTPEQFYNLKLKTDSGNTYSFSEIKDAIQAREQNKDEYAAKLAAVEQKEKEVHEAVLRAQQSSQAVSQEVQQVQQEIAGIEQQYAALSQYSDQLLASDDTDTLPKVQAEMTKLQGQYAQAQQKLNVATQNQQAMQQQAMSTHLQQQQQTLANIIPEWREPEKRSAIQEQLKGYLTTLGLTSEEINQIYDARVVNIVYKAMLYDKHQADVTKTKDTIKQSDIKRIVKGSRPGKTNRSKEAIDIAQKSHKERDKRAAFRAVAEEAGLFKGIQ